MTLTVVAHLGHLLGGVVETLRLGVVLLVLGVLHLLTVRAVTLLRRRHLAPPAPSLAWAAPPVAPR